MERKLNMEYFLWRKKNRYRQQQQKNTKPGILFTKQKTSYKVNDLTLKTSVCVSDHFYYFLVVSSSWFLVFFLQICSLMRGGIAERGGVRVGHRIIEINGQSVVATPHEKIVQILSNAMGEVRTETSLELVSRTKCLPSEQTAGTGIIYSRAKGFPDEI